MDCDGCDLISLAPLPSADEVAGFYPPGYSPYQPAVSLLTNSFTSALRSLMIAPYTLRFGRSGMTVAPHGAGRLLEIGCGGGVFLGKMCDLGWDATGIDLSPLALESARVHAPRALLYCGTLDSVPLEGKYDLIVMQHVLEHIAYPSECLTHCYDLLASGGVISIAVPNISSPEATLFSRSWIGLDIPRHLVHFRLRALLRLLERCGFEIVSARPQLMPSTLSESLLLLLPTPIRRRLLSSRVAHALYLCSIFPSALSNALGNWPAVEVRARKPANA